MSKQNPEFVFTQPGALIAALPALLGFVPEMSLVVVTVEQGHIGAAMRVDLSPGLAARVDQLADLAMTSDAESVVAVIVDADGAQCPMCRESHRELCEALESALANRGIRLYASHVVDRIDKSGRWYCADGCEAGGAVEDPSASPLAAAAVLEGRRLYGRRSDLHAVIDRDGRADHSALVDSIEAHAALRRAEWQSAPDLCGRRDVEAAMKVAGRVLDGVHPTDAELARLACGITDVAVRDTLYALSAGEQAAAAEALWAVMSRVLPDPWRVEALVLLAFSAYARGDGPLAGISLEAALRSDPDHRMAGMLDTALQSGMRPAQIRELASTGYRLAKRLGVRLPPRREFGKAV